MKINQTLAGFALIILSVIIAFILIPSQTLFFRFLIGFGFGFALVKASLGFAGSVNRLSRAGTSATTKSLMLMFLLTAILTAFVISGVEESYKLNIYPINFGLLFGGLLFGFGMALSSCCATGSLTDLSSAFSKAIVTIFFFTIGVFLGFSYQSSAPWIKESWLTSTTGASSYGGVFLPDLFTFDGTGGYLGAIMMTAVLAFFVILLAQWYERKLGMVKAEMKEKKPLTKLNYENFFIKPWSMTTSTIMIAVLFVILLVISEKGWSATSAFGLWFAKLLMVFGVSAESISAFTGRPIAFFTQSLLEYGSSLQNFGIVLGSVTVLLLAKEFNQKFIASLAITPTAFFIYSFGGFIMGFGTRLSNGCNVGALYTPISEFSLSGWIYLVVVAVGGFSGNWFIKRYVSRSCQF